MRRIIKKVLFDINPYEFIFNIIKMKSNLEETAATIPNYKMVDGKYYIKTAKLGKGNFAETY